MIIGLVGYAGAGKDTAADGLPTFQRVAFADPLRTAAAAIFGLTLPMAPDLKTAPGPTGVSYRRGLQVLGTEVVRNQFSELFPELKWDSKEHWIHLLGERIKANPEQNYIVTDVRFLNEAKAIRAWGGHLVLVKGRVTESTDLHPSEMGVKEIFESEELDSLVVQNDSTVEALHGAMRDLVKRL